MKHISRKIAFFALVIGLFLTLSQSTKAQSALDGFDPNANGTVRAIVVQPDGKIVIGGLFTMVQGVVRNRIARLNPDGTLDTGFDPNANNYILSIALQADGKILLGGDFTTLAPNGGAAVTRNRIARLNTDGMLDTSFDPNANYSVYSIALQADGKILMSGVFTTLAPNGATAVISNRIARLNADGILDTAFNPKPNGAVLSIALQADGKILIGGDFTTLAPNSGTVTRNHIARLNADSTLDAAFDPNANYDVFPIVLQADGKILIGGDFTTLAPNGGATVTRNKMARLNADGTLDTAFNPNSNNGGGVYSIALQADGKILIGGDFMTLAPNGGATVTRKFIARVNTDGTLDTAFNPSANGDVRAIALQADGKILIGGDFTTLALNGAAVTRNNIARLERDGRLDQTLNLLTVGDIFATATQPDGKILVGGAFRNSSGTPIFLARLNTDGTFDTGFSPNVNGDVYSIAIQSDGKILIGGYFNGAGSVGGQTRNAIARLNADGSLDAGFDPNANGTVWSIVVQPDGKILVGGNFSGANSIGGQARTGLVRLNTDGTADSFDPNANSAVHSILLMPDGKIIAGGYFTTIGGQTRNLIARLNPNGTIDSFNPNAEGGISIDSIALQSDGKILVGGNFGTIGGQQRNNIARLNSDGTVDSFNPIVNGNVLSIAVQANGKILVSGYFTIISGQPRNHLARLNPDGIVDSFNPNVGGSSINSIALQSDGKILVGGNFNTIGGQSRGVIARLTNDSAAFSTLTVTKTTVILTRDGSAPQFNRVIFELSTDNGATYTTLGTATNSRPEIAANDKSKAATTFTPAAPQAAGYTLFGQNLPTGQNILVRARGFYNAGYQNGSQMIEDKVQIAYLLAPTAVNVSIGGRIFAQNGRGLSNALIYLTDQSGATRIARSSAFGYYRFDDLAAGQTVIMTVVSKRFNYLPQVINLTESLSDVNFTSQPLSEENPIKPEKSHK